MKKLMIRAVGIIIAVAIGFPPMVIAGRTMSDGELRALAPAPLSEVFVPEPDNLAKFVRDPGAAIRLGKAWFWDMQVGSDGIQACASCHFHAGADNRSKNQLSPGLLDISSGADPEEFFSPLPSGGAGGPNYTLVVDDFFFPKEMNDVASSQGVFHREFLGINRGRSVDVCEPLDDFFVTADDGAKVRRVEPRNTPTVINAVFNHRNFWDGRASNLFNGVNPLGLRGLQDPDTGIYVWKKPDRRNRRNRYGTVELVQMTLNNSSLASQAVGPPESPFEMSCNGRTLPFIGKKLLSLKPLAKQKVDPRDSVLGPVSNRYGKGLRISYRDMIKQAFRPEYWGATGTVTVIDGTAFTQMEANFSLFWGLAIQLYEATLVSDQTPFDQFAAGDNRALTEQEKHGLEVFLNKGKCINCHDGPEFTGASVRLRANQPDGNEEPIERMVMGDGGVAVYDGGFYNIGVRQTLEDLGVGAELAGFPLSFARQEVEGPRIDEFNFDPDNFEVPGPIRPGERVAVDGAFKVPTVRNVELTGPYFHNGGRLSLEQVVEFYDEGAKDPFGFHSENRDNLDPDIVNLGLSEEEEAALVAFMKSLTDERVRWEEAPFDHPQLFIPDGHPGDEGSVVGVNSDGEAVDALREIPAVGANGRQHKGLPPLRGFMK